MKSQTANRRTVQFASLRAPIVACLMLGMVGCASAPRFSISSLWKRKSAEETASKEKSSKEKTETAKTNRDKAKSDGEGKTASKPGSEVAKRGSGSKSFTSKKPASSTSPEKSEEKPSVSALSERRDRLRNYLKREDEKKSEIAGKIADPEEKPIRRVSKSESDPEEGLLSSMSSRKRASSASDPFLDEEDPIAAASTVKSKSQPASKGRSLKDEFEKEESADAMSDLDREMAELGLQKKKKAAKDESVSRLESLLESGDESPASTKVKRVAKTSSDAEGNPFESLDESSDEPVSRRETTVARKPAQKPKAEEKFAELESEETELPVTKSKIAADDLGEEEINEVTSKPAKQTPVSETKTKGVAKSTPAAKAKKAIATGPRQQADELVAQALEKMKKNQFDEACGLAESAAKLEEDHQLEYAAGEESPARLLNQLHQLQNMLAKEAPAAVNPARTPAPVIKPNPATLPKLSTDLQPIDDETAAISNSSETQRVSFTTSETDGEETKLAVASEELTEGEQAAAVPQQEVAATGSESNPFEESGAKAAPAFHEEKGPELKKAGGEGEAITAFASSVPETLEEVESTRARSSNSLGLMLVGISLISLGCAGVFVWRAMRPSGTPHAAVAVAPLPQSEKGSEKKGA